MKIFYTIPLPISNTYYRERAYAPMRGGHNPGGKKKISQIAKKPSILGMYTLAGTTTTRKEEPLVEHRQKKTP